GERRASFTPGDAEIEHLDLLDLAAGQEQVAGLEIAVDDAAGVSGAEGLGEPRRELDGLARGERRAREAALEALAVEPLHGEEQLARGHLAVGEVTDDAGM